MNAQNDLNLMLYVVKTIRTLCASRNHDIQRSLKANGIISKLLQILDIEEYVKEEDGEKLISIHFYCKMSLLELCHNQDN